MRLEALDQARQRRVRDEEKRLQRRERPLELHGADPDAGEVDRLRPNLKSKI